MTIFNSRDLIWTEPMQVWAEHKIVEPIRRYLNNERFDLSIHWDLSRGLGLDGQPRYELWAVLQTFDGSGNQIVRCRGNDFCNLADEVAHNLRAQLRHARISRRFFFKLFRPTATQEA
jgi:hypothetical protein